MKPIAVAVNGILGKMGREVVSAVCQQQDMILVGGADIKATQNTIDLPFSRGHAPIFKDIAALLDATKSDVLVDFSAADAALNAIRVAAERKTNVVIGTTGFSADSLKQIETISKDNGIGIVIADNFALGAVLMMHLAKIASMYFDYAEIIEAHNYEKADAPSGTALATVRGMIQAKGKPFVSPQTKTFTLQNVRGGQVDGVTIHSVRLPGLVANQEVIFAGQGQTLSIKHDTINRECFMPGVMLAIREVVEHHEFVYGLEKLLHLGGT
ncbi:MAG TPA: 4-hydroxy-tetrahydrodipicolinate reductase [Dehalococcoidia bacterium]|nr:4-hydroxy-tetrahydrodipicolinate reductase [Dehalococcoidia bacterium]